MMAGLNEAWGVLRDPRQRAVYDARLTPLAAAAERRRQATQRSSDRRTAGGIVLQFGRYAGTSVAELALLDPDYLEWLVRAPIGRAYRAEIDAVLANRRASAAAPPTAVASRPSRLRFGRRG